MPHHYNEHIIQINEDKCKRLFDCLTNVDEKYIEESYNGKLKRRRPVWLKWCPMVACLFIIVAAALIINKGPVGNGGHNSEYPYDDNKVLNYVGGDT